MEHEIVKKEFSVTETNITFDSILNKPYIPREYLEEIKRANLLLIPTENFREHRGVFFPEITEEFFYYIKETKTEDVRVDIACSDEELEKLELHSACIIIPSIVVSGIILPIIINIISSFLYDKAKSHNRKPEELSAEINIVVQEGKISRQITYKGPVDGIKDTLEATVPRIFDK